MNSISVNVDLDEVYWQMSQYDKEKMAEWLADDDIMKSVTEIKWPDAQSATEVELVQLLQDVWNNKISLTDNDFSILSKLGKKGLYD
jgi:hypothetical protein